MVRRFLASYPFDHKHSLPICSTRSLFAAFAVCRPLLACLPLFRTLTAVTVSGPLMLSLHAKGYSSQQLLRHAAAPPASRQSGRCCGSGRPEAFLCCCSVSFCCKEGCRGRAHCRIPSTRVSSPREPTRIRKSSYAERYNMITRFAARKSISPRANQRSLCRAITAALQYILIPILLSMPDRHR